MIRHLLALVFLLFAGVASAQVVPNYTVCDCGIGAQTGCVPGSSGNSGTSVSSPKQSFAQLPNINTRPAGTVIGFCKGGAIPWSLIRLENPNSTKASPITFTSYDPPWGGTERPILYTNPAGTTHATASAFEFGGFFDEVDDIGYVFRGLHLKGPGTQGMTDTTRAWLIWGVLSAGIWEDNEVEGFLFPWEMTNGPDGGDPQLGTGFWIKNNYVHHNSMGILGSRQDLFVEGNLFYRNNDGCPVGNCGFNHGGYIGTGRGFASNNGSVFSQRTTVRKNVFRDNSINTAGNCDGGSLTMHGRFDQLDIEENLIEVTVGASTTNCYGISLNAGYGPEVELIKRLRVRANTVANVGNVCIESNINGGGAVYENNKCIKTRVGGNAPSITLSQTDNAPSIAAGATANNTIVRHNSWYVTVPAPGSLITVNAGTGHQVYSNLASLSGTANANCWSPGARANFAVWDYNQCSQGGSGLLTSAYPTLAAFQAAGFGPNDTGILIFWAVGTPSPANNWDLSLTTNRLGRSAGRPRFDSKWCERASTPTRGAHEFNPTSCTSIRASVNFWGF
jgi:hypothetical protein